MKVDAGIGSNLKEVPEMVTRLESLGYDGIRTAEMNHDLFSACSCGRAQSASRISDFNCSCFREESDEFGEFGPRS